MSWGVVPAVIERLVRQHPRLSLHVSEGDPVTLRYHELPERRIDLAIGRIMGPFPDDDIDAEVLFTEKAFVVTGRQSVWAKRRKIGLSELVTAPWCAPPEGSFARSLLADAFKEQGLPSPRVNAISFSMPLYSALLATGNFLCVLPNSMLQLSQHLLSIKVLPIDLPTRPSPAGIITLKKRTLSPVARLFIEHAREVTTHLGASN